jgi:hypothetical protein
MIVKTHECQLDILLSPLHHSALYRKPCHRNLEQCKHSGNLVEAFYPCNSKIKCRHACILFFMITNSWNVLIIYLYKYVLIYENVTTDKIQPNTHSLHLLLIPLFGVSNKCDLLLRQVHSRHGGKSVLVTDEQVFYCQLDVFECNKFSMNSLGFSLLLWLPSYTLDIFKFGTLLQQ